MSSRKTTIRKDRYYLKGIEKMHPFKSIVLLFNLISVIILSFLIFNFEMKIAGQASNFHQVQFSDIFYLSTLILFSSIFFTNQQGNLYQKESLTPLKKTFYLQLFISTLFIVLQMMAIYRFQLDNNELLTEGFKSYVILLVSFHLVYMILSIVMMMILLFRLINVMEDPVKTLVYITNPFEKLLIEIKQMIWNYQVGLWVIIYLYLLFRF